MAPNDMKWHDVAAADEVGEVMPLKVQVSGRSLLICRTHDGFYAVDEICPHKNESMQYGVIFDGTIICPHHQYGFDLQTGACNKRRCPPVDVYPCEARDGRVWVEVPA